jgi:hypothetical protein
MKERGFMASNAHPVSHTERPLSYAKRMSTHIAYALVIYTLLLIFEVSPQMESDGMSIMPYFVLVFLVGLVIWPCRNLERRWQALEKEGNMDLSGRFRRDVIAVWVLAIGIPTALMAVFYIIP